MSPEIIPELPDPDPSREILPTDAATEYRYGACDACGRPPDWFAPSVPQAEAEESWEESWAVCEACKTRWLVGLIVNGYMMLPPSKLSFDNPFAGMLQFGDILAAAADVDKESAPYDNPDRWRAEYREVSGDPPPWVIAWFKAQQDASDQIGVADDAHAVADDAHVVADDADADARHPAQKRLFPEELGG